MVKITELHLLKCSIGSFTLDEYSTCTLFSKGGIDLVALSKRRHLRLNSVLAGNA